MEREVKLRVLADAAKYDTSCASSGSTRKREAGGIGNAAPNGICHSFTPDGRCVSLLKILLTNYCIYDCVYCVNRVSSDTPRARFTVAEVVELTLDFYKRNYIEGLFLSSGIIQSPDYTMEQLLEVARRLRVEHKFGGYIHLKAIPGASQELLTQAGQFADRLSLNIELPAQRDLDRLAPAKQHTVIERGMEEIRSVETESRESGGRLKFAPAGQTTQMVIGATEDTDAQILGKATSLYNRYGLRRVYYSAFSPIPHASGELPVQAPPLIREHRLYQADWLVRFYGFRAEELTSNDDPMLSYDWDPKLGWALRNRQFFPVDVNRAPRETLLRVPGLGARNVKRILQVRKYRQLRMDDLRKLRVPVERAKQFLVTVDGGPRELERLSLAQRFRGTVRQLSLFEAPLVALRGEL